MSYRFMRMIVMFDLPSESAEEKRNYRRFRKALITNGFYMMQESVYTRMLITPSAQLSALEAVRRNKPQDGVVQVMTVTEKQFSKMEYIVGEHRSETLDSDKRLVIL